MRHARVDKDAGPDNIGSIGVPGGPTTEIRPHESSMSTLSTSIVQLGFVSERDVEEALARQVMYGGDLGSNLLELGVVSETDLLEALADASGLPKAPGGELPIASEDARKALPEELIRRHRVHPAGVAGETLELVVTEPLAPQLEKELAECAGRHLTTSIAPRIRVDEAIARDFGAELPDRSASILKRLAGTAKLAPIEPGVTVDFKQLPRPQSVPPMQFAGAALEGFDIPTGPPPLDYEELKTSYQETAKAPSADRGATGHHRGPYTAAMAERALFEARGPDGLLRAFFDFAAQYFEYTALFIVRGNEAVGRLSRGPGAPERRMRSIRVPLDLPSAFSRVKKAGAWTLVRLRAGGIEGGITTDLRRPTGRKILLLPVVLRERMVILLYGDHGNADVDLGSIGDVISFAPLVSAALEHAILQKKRGAHAASSLVPRPPLKETFARPTRQSRAQALASVLGEEPEPPTRAYDRSAARDEAPPEPSPESMAKTRRRPTKTTRKSTAAPPYNAPEAHEPVAAGTRSWTESSAPPFAAEPAKTLPGFPAARSGSDRPRRRSEPPEPIEGRPTLSLEPAALPDTGPVEIGVPPAPRLGDVAEPPESGWDSSEWPEFGTEAGTQLGVGASGDTQMSIRAPAQPPEELVQPEVIEAPKTSTDAEALVRRLCDGDERALEPLLEAGELATAALVGHFPGPIPVVLRRDSSTRASECGPVLHALAQLGSSVLPYLTVRTADEDPHVREWATRLLGELPSREAAQAVARRLVDDVVDVRRAALAAARMLSRNPTASAAVREHMVELASDPALPGDVRRSAIEALTDLRAIKAIPALIDLLGDSEKQVSRGAHWSLVVLSRQDFRTDADAWRSFWAQNQERHRVEWLIDALTHNDRDIRRSAGDELKAVSREYFGYYDDLPAAERAKAQDRYREWWNKEGRERFSEN